MPSDAIDLQQLLLQGAYLGDFHVVRAALEAGATVDGSPEKPYPPILAATFANHPGMVNFLLRRGADPDRPVTTVVPFPSFGISKTTPGERALHIAARSRKLEIVRLLLEQSRINPNATDSRDCTPLMATCECQQVCAEVVRLLLEAGADPALADEDGCIPLHAVAINGDDADVVGTLHSRAPAALNRCANKGETPLLVACLYGHESLVSKLLSLGAKQPSDRGVTCPLTMSVLNDFAGIVRVLVNEGGIRAVGGVPMTFVQAMNMAVRFHRAKVLQLLLAVDGEEGRSEWANEVFEGRHLLHVGAGYCCPSTVSVLLEAGADEAARDSEGHFPRCVIGMDIGRDAKVQMDRGKEVAVHRMLQRGPAYRARSWAWPSDEEVDAGGSGDGDAAAAADTAAAALLSPPAVKSPPVSGVRIFRPKKRSGSRNIFVRVVGRYSTKD